ncbi:MAG: hypothetical protein JWM16_805 [Verrucomicrobiales bacterium]|nr:hypothetical protein [Verrucomicrobiales bacterium]
MRTRVKTETWLTNLPPARPHNVVMLADQARDQLLHRSWSWLRHLPVLAALFQLGIAQAWGAFIETAGKVVMEAEHFQTNSSGSGHQWLATNNVAGFVGTAAMQALPDTGASLSSVSNSPLLSYTIQVTNAGTFNLWLRGWALNTSANTVYLGADSGTAQQMNYTTTGAWVWQSVRVTLTNAGSHQINLWMREDGAYVDRLILARDSAYVPAGTGPAETTDFSLRLTSPAPGASFPAGATVLLTASASGISSNGVRFYVDGLLLNAVSNAPYSFASWIPSSGTHQVKVAATDGFGMNFTSPPVNVTLAAPLAATFRWSPDSSRIYVESGGTATLSQIQAALPRAPLCLLDPTNHIWFLGATLFVKDGATLQLHGSAAGGDVNELRLRSDNSTADGSVAAIDADWGTLDLDSVKVTSWDQLTSRPDTETATFGRAFIRARSRQTNSFLQVSTLNVVNSEIAYLGDNQSASYALTWNVAGEAPDVTIRGTIQGSRIHDSGLGVASWGDGDLVWSGNTIFSNTLYGFAGSDPAQKAVVAANQVFSNRFGVFFRWANSNGRIYVTGPGDATLSDIQKALPQAPLTLVDPTNKIWYLGATLWVTEGARLKLYGPAIAGDVGQLRLKSDTTTASNAFVEVRADWGWLDIRSTKITSWNNLSNGPNTITNFGRAFIRARSTLDPDGHTAHESRMDVINSDIGYLGTHDTEAYGLVWKVVDTTAKYLPPGSTNSLFGLVNVYGDILFSHIHHNNFGVYTYGAYGCRWAANEVDHNMAYGLDPHDDSDQLLIENNHVHHNGWHGIIASKRCDHGILRNNISHDNGLDPIDPHGNGIMLHRSCSDWIVTNNVSYNNLDSGIAIYASDRTLVANNICSNNANAGIRLNVGAAQNRVEGNQFLRSGNRGIDLFPGDDEPELTDPLNPDSVFKPARPYQNIFTNNVVGGSGLEIVRVESADNNLFAGNVFTGASNLIRFVNSTNNTMAGNAWPTNTLVTLAGTNLVTNTFFTTTTFRKQPLLALQLENNLATAIFSDDKGAITEVDKNSVNTTTTPSGSTLNLTTTLLGSGTNTVRTRNFTAVPVSGTVLIHPTTWNLSGTFNKAWTAQASSASINVSYVVGNLVPGTTYLVNRGLTQVASAPANSQGTIAFTSSTGSTSPVTYTITPR